MNEHEFLMCFLQLFGCLFNVFLFCWFIRFLLKLGEYYAYLDYDKKEKLHKSYHPNSVLKKADRKPVSLKKKGDVENEK